MPCDSLKYLRKLIPLQQGASPPQVRPLATTLMPPTGHPPPETSPPRGPSAPAPSAPGGIPPRDHPLQQPPRRKACPPPRLSPPMSTPKTLSIEILSPRTNTLVAIGQSLSVGGTVLGRALPDPVAVETVLVQIGASPPVEATVKQ